MGEEMGWWWLEDP